MPNLHRLHYILGMFLFLTACGAGNGKTTGSELSYDLTVDRRCTDRFCKPEETENCTTKQSFTSQAGYCEGLRDSQLNKGCARRERKSLYFSKCGPSFEDINIEGWMISCPAGAADKSLRDLFLTRREYCEDLRDSNNRNCSGSFRAELAERYECGK